MPRYAGLTIASIPYHIARPKSFATILLDILSIFDIVEVCKQQNIHIQLLKFENEL